MILITGAAGFIGSHLVEAFNQRGETTILAVDDLTQGDKFQNLASCILADYLDWRELRSLLERGTPPAGIRAIYHQGACTDTTARDGRQMMEMNYSFSKLLFTWAVSQKIPFIYASSASVYGTRRVAIEEARYERPVNVYAYSKLVFDQFVRAHLAHVSSTVVGLRYFNVYGPNETEKGRMASMVYQTWLQLRQRGFVELFTGTDGFADGEQRRDFVSVEDCVRVNLFFGERSGVQGIFNVGTGTARSFNEVARFLIQILGKGEIRYRPFPDDLIGRYQSFTQADLSRLRAAGYQTSFLSIEEGIPRTVAIWEERLRTHQSRTRITPG